MNCINLFIVLSLAFSSCIAQNVLVNFWPNNQPFQGLTNWPDQVQSVSWSTNTLGWKSNMTASAYGTFMAAQWPIFNSAQSNYNWTYTTTVNSNYAAWYSIYTQIPIGITDSSNRISIFNSLLGSWNSGTNTAQGTNSIIKQTIQNQSIVMTYLNQIIGYLSRLGPGLQQVYQPANDPVGH